MSYAETDSESSSVDTFDMTEGASYARVTRIYFILFQNAIIHQGTLFVEFI